MSGFTFAYTGIIELEQHTYNEKEEIVSEGEGCVSKDILIKELKQMFRNLENVKQQIMDLDLDVERSMLVHQALQNGISCCRKLYEEKNKAASIQMMLDKYFSRN
jgi:hypothetical protein